MAEPAFLWSFAGHGESSSVLLWSKVVILIDGPRVARVDRFIVHPTALEARDTALRATTVAEEAGMKLVDIYGHRGWDTLTEQIAYAHQLHAEGRELYALVNVVWGIATRIIRDGEWLRD